MSAGDRYRWNWGWERKVADCWIGVFWKRSEQNLDIWVCVVPCFPFHVERRAIDLVAPVDTQP